VPVGEEAFFTTADTTSGHKVEPATERQIRWSRQDDEAGTLPEPGPGNERAGWWTGLSSSRAAAHGQRKGHAWGRSSPLLDPLRGISR